MFGNFADINVNTYASYFANVEAKVDDRSYGDIAEKVLENLKKTVIVNENGIFFYSGPAAAALDSENTVWFAPGLKVITAKHYEFNGTDAKAKEATSGLPAVSEFKLPASVLLVEANALDFVDASTEINLGKKVGDTFTEITNIFAPKSTNAIIVDSANRKFQIVVAAEGNTFVDSEGNPVAAGADILVENGAFVAYLTPKAPFETKDDWSIGYELTDDEQKQAANKDNWLLERPEALYLNIASVVDFYIIGADGTKSYSVKEWKSSNEDVISNNLEIVGAGVTSLTATVVHLDGHEDTHTIENIIVNAASEGSVKILNSYYKLDGGTYEFHWNYNEGAELIPVENGIQFIDDIAFAKGSNNISVEVVDAANSSLKATGNKLTKVDGKTADATIKISVDGELETTFKVSIIDNSNSPIAVAFYDKTNSDIYRYYIGDNNPVTLGALFNAKSTFAGFDLAGSKIVVYDIIDGDGVYQEANVGNPDSGVFVEFSGSNWTLGDNWKTQTLSFTREEDYMADPEGFDVWIKITPADGKTPIFVRVHVVDGWNVEWTADDAGTYNALKSALANYNAVLHDSFTMVTGQTLEINGKTLYGNGYVISADKYVASKEAEHTETVDWCNWCNTTKAGCKDYSSIRGWGYHTPSGEVFSNNYRTTKTYTYEHFISDDSMINIEGGVINNIYIHGPVYPELQYLNDECNTAGHDEHVYTGYHVSGIRATGTSTIINSYVSGFRQPVKAAGILLSLNNTVLRGGNYANLQVVSGNLYLKDVTTIQDQNGVQATIANSKGVYPFVTGVGILVESSAIGTTFTIDGYLDQHNWIEKNQSASLPVISTAFGESIDMNTIMSYMFDGLSYMGVKLNMVMSRFWYFIHQVEGEDPILDSENYNQNAKQYINASIMFIDAPETKGGAITAYNPATEYVKIVPVKSDGNNSGYTGRTYQTTGIQLSQEGISSLNMTADKILGTDLTAVFYSYHDGQVWQNKTNSSGEAERGKIFVNNPDAGYICVNNQDLYYDGYYTTVDSGYTGVYN